MKQLEMGYYVLGGIIGYVQKVFILWTIQMTYSHSYLGYNPCSHWHYNIFHFYNRPVRHMHNPCPLQKKTGSKPLLHIACHNISRHKVCLVLMIPIQHFKVCQDPTIQGADPGYVKRGSRDPKGVQVADNPKTAQK